MAVHYPERMRLRLPRGMPEALALAAGQRHTTPSEWLDAFYIIDERGLDRTPIRSHPRRSTIWQRVCGHPVRFT
jgi:hypothetical protein